VRNIHLLWFVGVFMLVTGCQTTEPAAETPVLETPEMPLEGPPANASTPGPCADAPGLCKAVVAHRGASFLAPEETTAAYVLARDFGADYLEIDLQRTKDGQLIAFHDKTLKRTTNVADVFPDRVDQTVEAFTLAELKQLDAGSWFNAAHPERARDGYAGLKILTLSEVIDIAEQGTHKPGLYIETKKTEGSSIEKDLRALLIERKWLQPRPKPADVPDDVVQVAYTPAHVVLQTFELESLERFKTTLPELKSVLLLWLGDGYIERKTTREKGADEAKADFYASQEVKSEEEFNRWLQLALDQGASGVGPSAVRSSRGDQSYADLMKPWMVEQVRARDLLIHVYTVDDPEDFKKYDELGAQGYFTNKPDVLLQHFGRTPKLTADEILGAAGI